MIATTDRTCPLVALLAARTPVPAPQPPPAAGPARLLWTLDKDAERISVGKSKLYGLIRTDQLASIMLGGRWHLPSKTWSSSSGGCAAGGQPW